MQVERDIGVLQNGLKMVENILKEGNDEVQAQLVKKVLIRDMWTKANVMVSYGVTTFFRGKWAWGEKEEIDWKNLKLFLYIILFVLKFVFYNYLFTFICLILFPWFLEITLKEEIFAKEMFVKELFVIYNLNHTFFFCKDEVTCYFLQKKPQFSKKTYNKWTWFGKISSAKHIVFRGTQSQK